jgi:uncharacterized FAD-dependent dehydrogenase
MYHIVTDNEEFQDALEQVIKKTELVFLKTVSNVRLKYLNTTEGAHQDDLFAIACDECIVAIGRACEQGLANIENALLDGEKH